MLAGESSSQAGNVKDLPCLADFTSRALKRYHEFVPDDMDWDIYEACAISLKEQRELRPDCSDGVPVLTYGEINFDCFSKVMYDLLKSRRLAAGGTFYDLGSGTGKVVLAAALLHDFSVCRGVELLEGLHEIAVNYKNSWDKSESTVGNSRIEYCHGSILDMKLRDWPKDADVVFCNTHCFDTHMMDALSTLAANMKPGAFFICTTVYPVGFTIIERFRAEMSWGVADGYILQKDH